MSELLELQTEGRNSASAQIDVASTLEICEILNQEDISVPLLVRPHIPTIALMIDALVERVKQGGRVIYLGAGTSGRLGVLDASEIPPTYSARTDLFIGLIAGGDFALRHPVEGAEDDRRDAPAVMAALSPALNNQDSVIGIASSGRTPWVLGGIEYAKSLGCYTAGIACTSPSRLRLDGNCAVVVEAVMGPEVVTGSTRMKAGTATKLILNMMSTGVMIRIGKTYGNLMVDVKTSNHKLEIRARGIFRSILQSLPQSHDVAPLASEGFDLEDDGAVSRLIEQAGGVKLAAIMARWGCSLAEASDRLALAAGVLKTALHDV